MKLTVPVLAIALAASFPLSSYAQTAPAQDGPPPTFRAAMEKARADAKTAALNDLSADHRKRVQAVVDQVNNGTTTDLAAAAGQIDAILSPAESKAVLGERDKMIQTFRANAPDGSQGGPRPGSPPSGGPQGGLRNQSAGRFLLRVSISPERMRELRGGQAPSR